MIATKTEIMPEVGMGVTERGWSDSHPWEIAEVISPRKIALRPMVAERDPDWKPNIIVGGFSGHCVNNAEQRWILKSNPTASTRLATKRKNGKWIWVGQKSIGSCAIGLKLGKAVYFYDYNF